MAVKTSTLTSDTLTLSLSETGAAAGVTFDVYVDNVRIAANQLVTASHSLGNRQSFTYQGSWGSGSHNVKVVFTNPSSSTALYLDRAVFDQAVVQGAATKLSTSTKSTTFAATAPLAGTGGLAGQGGYLLPTGYLSTSGNQVVDSAGNPVRVNAVGWDGTLLANSAPMGLNVMRLTDIIANMKADGFNTIRLPWTNAMLDNNTKPMAGQINDTLNPDLKGLTILQIFDKIVQAAGDAGMKVIFDHHNNEGKIGTVSTNPGQQANGLWFDVGPGTNGTDGSGNTGTVTAEKFKSDWITLATRYAGDSTVIGFDLHNEPTQNGNVNWGQGGPTDWWATATDVGNAIQKVDPGALIIVEGPQGGVGGGMPAPGPEGNLSGVAAKPVTLGVANKVVYSVHEYPAEITGRFLTPQQYVGQMNAAWGYLVNQNIAPVWVGEMGASMNSQQDQVWASTLISYMNGQLGPAGGPSFSGSQQPVGGDWWSWGYLTGMINGTLQSDWKTYRPEVQAITNQMVFKPITTTSVQAVQATPTSNATFLATTGGTTKSAATGSVNQPAPTVGQQQTLQSAISASVQSAMAEAIKAAIAKQIAASVAASVSGAVQQAVSAAAGLAVASAVQQQIQSSMAHMPMQSGMGAG